MATERLGQQHLDVADNPFPKRAFAVAEIEFPDTQQIVGQVELLDLIQVGVEPLTPVGQRLGVVGRDVLQVENPEVA